MNEVEGIGKSQLIQKNYGQHPESDYLLGVWIRGPEFSSCHFNKSADTFYKNGPFVTVVACFSNTHVHSNYNFHGNKMSGVLNIII